MAHRQKQFQVKSLAKHWNSITSLRSGAKPSQVQQGSKDSGEGSGEGLGGFGAEPGQVLQQGSGEGSGEGL